MTPFSFDHLVESEREKPICKQGKVNNQSLLQSASSYLPSQRKHSVKQTTPSIDDSPRFMQALQA
jgi:hypothetical protein